MALPIPQPSYIFRGHQHPIHHTSFIRSNTRLITGDSEGYLVIWSLATRRAVASWRAHEGAILDVKVWGSERLITHGKDNKLMVWQYTECDEEQLDKTLPVDGQGENNRKPWLLYTLGVNTLNFCSFGMCVAQNLSGKEVKKEKVAEGMQLEKKETEGVEDLLIAVPNTLTSEAVDIFHLPSCTRLMTVPGPQEDGKAINTGMVMAVSLLYLPPISLSTHKLQSPRLTLVTGYESGHTSVMQVLPQLGWVPLYLACPAKQPILSLSVETSSEKAYYITSGADSIVAKHPLSSLSPALPSTASAPSQPTTSSSASTSTQTSSKPKGPLSAAITSSPSPSSPVSQPEHVKPPTPQTQPLKSNNTHHSGQQSLTLRSDSKIFATAGWDGRCRVYSAKTLKEVAILKWHKDGVYAVGFAEVLDGGGKEAKEGKERANGVDCGDGSSPGGSRVRRTAALTVAEKRIKQATKTHWIAVGGKDGKVSLWDIY